MITNPEILAAALEGLELKLARVNAMIAEIKRGQGRPAAAAVKESAGDAPVAKKQRKKRKPLSEEARQRIAEAQKKRWAKAKKG